MSSFNHFSDFVSHLNLFGRALYSYFLCTLSHGIQRYQRGNVEFHMGKSENCQTWICTSLHVVTVNPQYLAISVLQKCNSCRQKVSADLICQNLQNIFLSSTFEASWDQEIHGEKKYLEQIFLSFRLASDEVKPQNPFCNLYLLNFKEYDI